MSKYLAVDIGASSGRLFEAELVNKKIKLKEIFRFENYLKYENNIYFWDIDKIYNSIITGLKKYFSENHEENLSLAIDTWGVDFALLDKKGIIIDRAVSYRDSRTNGIMKKFFDILSKDKIYDKTGIQFMEFNTLYQLYSMRLNNDSALDKTESFLMIPDYLNYLLTGEKINEITNVSTTQMLNYKTGTWDDEILDMLGLGRIKNLKLATAGTILGNIKEEVQKELGIKNLRIILPGTHDTASAIAAVPYSGNSDKAAYISSGTWSLMGLETDYIVNEKTYELNFTNEASVINGKSRFLKNIMGLWLIQKVKKEFNDQYSFSEIVELAKSEKEYDSLINPNAKRFLNPKSMKDEIYNYCIETKQEAPKNIGQYAKMIFYSLAFLYNKTLKELESLSNKEINTINIIGGGSQNEYLNQITANATKVKVVAGPIEATVLGNVIVQAVATNDIDSITEGRKIISDSSGLKEYYPEEKMDALYKKFLEIL